MSPIDPLALSILAAAPQPGPLEQLLWVGFPFVMMFVVFYFLMIRPQKAKEEQRQEMLKQLKKNDRVLTTGGIYGTVLSTKDHEVVLRVDDNVKLRFARNAIVDVESGKGEGEGGTKAAS